jgi:SAM-dependent methyltransferase
MMEINAAVASILNTDLVDLGEVSDRRFRGIYCSKDHFSSDMNSSQVYDFEKARTYHERHYRPDPAKRLLESVVRDLRIKAEPLVLDIGSGSGTSVAAALQVFEKGHVVATDICPDLLFTMKDVLGANPDYSRRLSVMCMDVHKSYFKESSFDFVCGMAILHHLIDPGRTVSNVVRALKPGGIAVFWEPFEYGCSVLRLVHERLYRESDLRKHSGIQGAARALKGMLGARVETSIDESVLEFLKCIDRDYEARGNISRGLKTVTPELDDKWLFTREFFESIAEEQGLRLQIRSNHIGRLETLFEDYIAQNLYSGRAWEKDVIPEWGWEIVRHFDRQISTDVKAALLIEGTVIFTKV